MTSTLALRGTGTALVTPFRADGRVDEATFRSLVRRQVEAGVRILVPCGTTGESATLSPAEKERLVRAAVEESSGRAHVVAGTGSNDTRAAVATAKAARDWGADAALSLVPPYNKPPQDGLVRHFRTVAQEAGIPVVVYNVPGRVGANLTAGATVELAHTEGIAGIKEASANLSQIMEILRRRPSGFSVLSGDDSWTFPLIAMGGDGVISVVGNQAPALFVRMVEGALAGEWDTARRIHFQLLPLMEGNFCESNPIPVKASMAMMGWIEDVLRPPLRPLSNGCREFVQSLLQDLNLLSEKAGQS